ncbi:lipopolysaccharide heptosyltransferase I [Herbaspirillum sp. RTI4]|uniref:lipopolysaccharide heptosyltransferase I n=1 Tax=Herbaspirillum sp. RTI4 TaxID=3048640 RepID=UPI002AB41DAD|nr:lipopolysaccharide heptosyltransferase I [Herbaspirillum sp. RTI4]MDY7577631.1 lipopolysaccharide heptosyltransferase I [Herbaspirillum sp. RTI4]MEA9982203.1 lipopolysaccharide heptosyltransferase I [Herbaspirillum sp. RTI4]
MNILIVRVSSLGDVIHNMPMVADIQRHFPDARIDWVVEEAYTDLILLNRHVGRVIPVALRRWRKSLGDPVTRRQMRDFYRELRREAYDIVFDTQGLIKTALLMRMARLQPGGKRVGLANATEGSGFEPVSRIFHTQSVPVGLHTHAVTRARVVAAKALGYQLDAPADFALDLPSAGDGLPDWLPTEKFAVFFHSTARDAKRWDLKNWIELAKECARRGLLVLLPWGNEAERVISEELAAQIPNARVLPPLALTETVVLVQHATLVVGLDTGLTHVAAAYARPTIELYCDSPRWKTQGDWSPNIINLGDLATPPGVAQVRVAMTTLLGAPDTDRSGILC